MRHANVRNADEVEVREMIKGRHNMHLRQLGKPAGSIALGATLTEVAPGGISFPRHAHYVNEEATYVLSGSGGGRRGNEGALRFHDAPPTRAPLSEAWQGRRAQRGTPPGQAKQ